MYSQGGGGGSGSMQLTALLKDRNGGWGEEGGCDLQGLFPPLASRGRGVLQTALTQMHVYQRFRCGRCIFWPC